MAAFDEQQRALGTVRGMVAAVGKAHPGAGRISAAVVLPGPLDDEHFLPADMDVVFGGGALREPT